MDLRKVTEREREVFGLLGSHLTHEQIGQRLFISVRTVESHVASLRRKLGIPDHRTLVKVAAEHRSAAGTRGTSPPAPLTSFVGRERGPCGRRGHGRPAGDGAGTPVTAALADDTPPPCQTGCVTVFVPPGAGPHMPFGIARGPLGSEWFAAPPEQRTRARAAHPAALRPG